MANLVFSVSPSGISTTPYTTSLVTSLTSDEPIVGLGDVTVTTNVAMPMGKFTDLNGDVTDIFIHSDRVATITSITPDATNASGSWVNGAMIDPLTLTDQGFDERYASTPSASRRTPYTHAKNIDPAAGGAIAIAVGDNFTIVKQVHGTTGGEFGLNKRFVYIHVVSEVPMNDMLPPSATAVGVNGTPKPMMRKPSDTTLNAIYPTLDLSGVSGLPTAADAIGNLPECCIEFGRGSEPKRIFTVDYHINGITNGYSQDRSQMYGRARTAIMGDSSGSRLTYLRKLAYFDLMQGQQTRSTQARDGFISGGAGQGGTTGAFLWAQAILLGDTALQTATRSINTQMTNGRWVSSSDLTSSASGGNGVRAQPYFEEMIGLPFSNTDEARANWDGRYTGIQWNIQFWDMMPILAMNGMAAAIINGAYNVTNANAADVALMEFIRKVPPDYPDSSNSVTQQMHDVHDVIWPETGLTAWTGRPWWPSYKRVGQTTTEDIFFAASGTAGQATYDVSDYNGYGASEPVTSVWTRHTQDGRSWIEVDRGTNYTGTITGLNPGPHYFGFALESASGKGEYLPNHPYALGSSTYRSEFTVAGTQSGAPAFSTAPQLLTRRSPSTEDVGNWKPAPASPTSGQLELAVGIGYVTGVFTYPDHFSFKYQESADGSTGWTDISGATTLEWTPPNSLAGKYIRGFVTIDNGVDSPVTSATSNMILVPSAAEDGLPSGTIIDTTFGPGFTFDYETVWNGVVLNAATKAHKPFAEYNGSNAGLIQGIKTNSWPHMQFPLTVSVGVTYRVEAEVVTDFGSSPDNFNGSLEFYVRNSSDNSNLITPVSNNPDPNDVRAFYSIDETFTATEATIYVRVRNASSSGGTAGGWPGLSYLKIAEVP